MNKLFKRMSSLALVVAMLFCMMSNSALAAGYVEEEAEEIDGIVYTIYDADGNVRETGIVPNPAERFTWKGITLINGEFIRFYLTRTIEGQDVPFLIDDEATPTINVQLDRVANVKVFLDECTPTGQYLRTNSTNTLTKEFTTIRFTSMNITSPTYFYLQLTNFSADPVTITSITFLY